MLKQDKNMRGLLRNQNSQNAPSHIATKASHRTEGQSNLQKQNLMSEKHRFPYSFNDYLKLTLAKIIPSRNIIFLPQEQMIVGSAKNCRNLQQQVRKQFQAKSFKVVKFKTSVDIDRIEFSIDPLFEAQIYRPKIIRMVLQELCKHPCFEEECQQMSRRVERENIVLLRVAKQYQLECLDLINRIIGGKDQEQQSSSLVQQTVFQGSHEQQNTSGEQNSELVKECSVFVGPRKKFNMSKYLNEGSSLNSSLSAESQSSYWNSESDWQSEKGL